MNENDRLEVVLAANFQQVLAAINSTNSSLKNTVSLVKSVKATFDSGGKLTGFTATAQTMKETATHTKSLNTNLNQTRRILNVGFNLGKLYLLWNVTKRIRDTITGWIESSVNFIETTNKFEVAMGNMSDRAYSFQRRLSEAFGTVTTDMMNFQATFKNIMSSLPGLTNEMSEQVSETLVKLGLDYSSLYNVNQDTAMSRIQAALVGSVKPIRNDAGYDITEATIGMKAQELGIETSVRNLNQMEKRLLRIIVLMDQMRNTGAMQDLARTIEQPANQIKVLKQQVQELGVWLGNVFIGTIGAILPYINGFIMALVAIVKTLAIFVGYTNTGSGLAEGLQEAETATEGIASGVGGAAKSAKELKKTLMGFDVLNVIQTPSESSGGGGGGGASLGTINPAILNALKDYDNLMNSVKMKATEIRDKIMDWLGFTKVLNPITGEISWKLRDGATRFKTILNILKTAVGLIAGIKILGRLRNLITLLKTGQATGLTPFKSGLVGVTNGLKGMVSWIKDAGQRFSYFKSLGATTGQALAQTGKEMWALVPVAAKAVAGVAGLAASLYGVVDASKAFATHSKSTTSASVELGISLAGAAASGALLGSIIPGVGTAVGAVTGFLIAGAAAIGSYLISEQNMAIQTTITKEEVEALSKEIEESRASFEAAKDTIQKTAESKLIDMEYSKKLSSELENLVDSNGKVIAGNEERVDYILGELSSALGEEYKRNGDIISINGEVVKSYKTLQKSIADTVKQKELEIKKDAILELSKQTTKRQIELEIQRRKVREQLSAAVKEYNNAVENGMNAWTMVWSKKQRDITNNVVNLRNEYDSLENELQQVSKDAEIYTDLMTDNIVQSLIEQSQSVDTLGHEQISKWQELAKNNRDKYNQSIQLIPEDVRTVIARSTNEIVNETNKSLPSIFNATKRIKDTINSNIKGKFDVKFNLLANYTELKEKLINMKNMMQRMANVPMVGSAFKGYANNIQTLINSFATGGFPETGEFFFAREAGPELVGSIGNRNAVVNNDQIVEAVSTGVANAVASVLGNGGSSYQLIIDGEQITDVVQRRLQRRANITGMAMGG